MRRIAATLAAIAAMLALTTGSALAAGQLDQQQTDIGGWNGGSPIWNSDYYEIQTFTAGYSRTLLSVSIYAGYWGPTSIAGSSPAGTATLEVLPMSNGVPDFVFVWARETRALPADANIGWVTFTISTPFDVVAGTQYAIMLQAHAPWGIDWLGTCSANYAGGQAMVMNSFDSFSLRTIPNWGAQVGGGPSMCTHDLAFKTTVASPAATPTPAPTAAPAATPTPAPTSASGATTGAGAFPPAPPAPPASTTATAAAAAPTPTTTSVVAPIVAAATQAGGTAAASPTPAPAAAAAGSPPSSSDPPIAVFVLAAAGLGGAALLLLWKLPGFLAARK